MNNRPYESIKPLSIQVPAVAPGASGYVQSLVLGRRITIDGILIQVDKPSATCYVRFGFSTGNVADDSTRTLGTSGSMGQGTMTSPGLTEAVCMLSGQIALWPMHIFIPNENVYLWANVENRGVTDTINAVVTFLAETNPDTEGNFGGSVETMPYPGGAGGGSPPGGNLGGSQGPLGASGARGSAPGISFQVNG